MPQGRIVLKSICQSRKMAALKTDGARLLYTWLIPNLDINGCYSADPEILKGQIFTRLKKNDKQIEEYLEDMVSVGLIIVYKSNNDIYLNVPDFKEKQPSLNPSREAEPTIPLPTQEQLQSYSRLNPLKVKESKDEVKESKSPCGDSYEEEFLTFWNNYPKKVGKGQAYRSWKKIKGVKGLLPKMLEAIEQQEKSDQWKKNGGQFIPNPTTWLNGSRWEDEVVIPAWQKKLNELIAEKGVESAAV